MSTEPHHCPAVVKIRGVQGRLVRALKGGVPSTMQWGGHDADGRPVPSGLYFYRLTSAAQGMTGKLVRIT